MGWLKTIDRNNQRRMESDRDVHRLGGAYKRSIVSRLVVNLLVVCAIIAAMLIVSWLT